MLRRLGFWMARRKSGGFVAPPAPTGDGTQWDFQFTENSGHLLTCGVM